VCSLLIPGDAGNTLNVAAYGCEMRKTTTIAVGLSLFLASCGTSDVEAPISEVGVEAMIGASCSQVVETAVRGFFDAMASGLADRIADGASYDLVTLDYNGVSGSNLGNFGLRLRNENGDDLDGKGAIDCGGNGIVYVGIGSPGDITRSAATPLGSRNDAAVPGVY
jgi:hypothetical protein